MLTGTLVVLATGPAPADVGPQQQASGRTVSAERVMGVGVLPPTVAIYDSDNSGDLSVEEKQVMDADRDNRHQTFRNRWDTNKDGRVSPAEEQAARDLMREMIRQRRLQRFAEVDLTSANDDDGDGNLNEPDGFLSADEFVAINAVAMSDNASPGMADAIFNHIDSDGDGLISQAEFLESLEPQRIPPPEGTTADPLPPKVRTTLSGN